MNSRIRYGSPKVWGLFTELMGVLKIGHVRNCAAVHSGQDSQYTQVLVSQLREVTNHGCNVFIRRLPSARGRAYVADEHRSHFFNLLSARCSCRLFTSRHNPLAESLTLHLCVDGFDPLRDFAYF